MSSALVKSLFITLAFPCAALAQTPGDVTKELGAQYYNRIGLMEYCQANGLETADATKALQAKLEKDVSSEYQTDEVKAQQDIGKTGKIRTFGDNYMDIVEISKSSPEMVKVMCDEEIASAQK